MQKIRSLNIIAKLLKKCLKYSKKLYILGLRKKSQKNCEKYPFKL